MAGCVLRKRQREVLHLVAQGYSNAEIAEQLGIGENSVSNYIHCIMNALGLFRRIHLVIFALKTSLITLDEIDIVANMQGEEDKRA